MNLINGEALEEMAKLPDASFDAIITDPPYGTTACKWDSVIEFEAMWLQLKRLIKPRGAIVLFGGQPFTSAIIMSNPKCFKYSWVWVKNIGSNFAVVKYQPMKEHEDVTVFSYGTHNYYPIRQERAASGVSRAKYNDNPNDKKREGMGEFIDKKRNPRRKPLRVPSSVQKFNTERGLHPTQKPVALLEYLIKTYTLEGQHVLDFTMGSGTTGVACQNLGRAFTGIELDAAYFEIAKQRIEAGL